MTLVTSVNFSPNKYSGHNGSIVFIGIHTMEAPESGVTAENVANYFKNSSVQASSHWCVDNDSRVRCVNDADSAWTMPPVNGRSLNIEMAGYAAQSPAQWSDPYSLAVLDNVAVCAAEWCVKYGIPVRHLTPAQIANMEKGFVGHVDVNNVFHASDHTDPGPNFPWAAFLNRVSARLGSGIVTPPPPVPSYPAWPFGQYDYLAMPSPDPYCHSGYYYAADRSAVSVYQNRMRARGWAIPVTGLFDQQTSNVTYAFQLEKGVNVLGPADRKVGIRTWTAAWTAPIT
jgi:N-acetyl-anhydromuramyl-L-alanine amidase AmpD